MRLGLVGYFAVGLILGIMILAIFIHPTAPTDNGSSSSSSSGDVGDDTPVAPICGDQQYYYKAEGTIRLYVDNEGAPSAQFVYVNVVRYKPSKIPKLPNLPALSWTTADYRVKIRYISPIGSVKTMNVWEGSVDYGDYKTVSFEVDFGHCTGGTLQLIVERMDGSNFITDTYNAIYRG